MPNVVNGRSAFAFAPRCVMASPIAATSATAAIAHGKMRFAADSPAAVETIAASSDPPRANSSSVRRASPMSRRRFFGLRSRQPCNNRRTARGVEAGSFEKSISVFKTPARVSLNVSAANGDFPLNIS